MPLYRLSRRGLPAVLIALPLLSGCTLPFDFVGGKKHPPPPPHTSASWEGDTAAAAQAFEEGRLEDAEHRLELARERAAADTGGNQLDVAASLSNLAVVRRAQGDITGAIEVQKEALAIREKSLGPDDLEVAATLNSLGGLYALNDDYAAAEPLLVRALAIREQTAGADDRRTAESVNNLALLYAAQGRPADAEPLYQRAITIFEQRQRPDQLATTLENYAALLADTGRTEQADEMGARARALRADVQPTPANP